MSSRDDTPTWRKNKTRIQTSDDRALQHRHGPSSPGIPLPAEDDAEVDTTSPFDLFEPQRMTQHRRRGDSALTLAAKLRHEAPDPYDLIAAMAFELTSAKEQERSASKELDKQFKAFLSQQPGGKEFEDLKRTIGLWKWIGGAILTAALGSLGIGLSTLWSSAERAGETKADISRLKQDVQQLLRGEFAPRHQPKDPLP